MRKKFLLFIGIIALAMSFLLVSPKTKALKLYNNLFDGLWELGTINDYGSYVSVPNEIRSVNFINFSKGKTYIIKRLDDNLGIRIAFYDTNGEFIERRTYSNTNEKIFNNYNKDYKIKIILMNTNDTNTKALVEEITEVYETKVPKLYDDYNAMVVGWDGIDYVWITFFDYDETTTLYMNKYEILDNSGTYPLLEDYPFINGIKLKLTFSSNGAYGEIVEEKSGIQIFTEDDMAENQVYEYKGIYDNMYLFQRGLNFYKVEMEGKTFINEISTEIVYITTLIPGNQYVYYKNTNQFRFVDSYNYGYYYGYSLGTEEGYHIGHEDGYENGYENGYEDGVEDGYVDGYDVGYDYGYDDGIEVGYDQGYQIGFKDGEESKLSKNTELFYSGIEKWLVPAIITVIVIGGFVSISALKRREQ